MRRLAATFLLALVLLLIGVVSLPYTRFGTGLLLGQLNRLEMLDIELRGGKLAGELELAHVRVVTDGVSVEALDVQSSLNAACIWRSAVCFEALRARTVTVQVSSGDDTPAAELAEKDLLRWPVRLEARAVEIGQMLVQWPGGHWQQGELSGAVYLYDSVLQLDNARLHDASLLLDSPQEEDENPAAALELPELYLPLDLQIGALEISGLETLIRGRREALAKVGLTGRWRAQQLELETLQLQSPRGRVSMGGELTFAGPWPLRVIAQAPQLTLVEYGEHRAELLLSGDLGQARVQLDVEGAIQFSLDADVRVLEPEIPFSGGLTLALAEGIRPGELFELPTSLADLDFVTPVLGQVEGTLSRQAFALEAQLRGLGYEQLQLRAEGEHSDGVVRLNELALGDEGSDSAILASGELGYAERLEFAASINSTGLALPAVHPDITGRIAGSGKVAGTLAGDQWQLSVDALDLAGEVNSLPALLTGYGAIHQDNRIGDTRLHGQLNGAELKLEATPAGEAVLLLQVDEFARWREGAHGGIHLTAMRPPGSDRFELDGELKQPGYAALDAFGGSIRGYFTTTLEQFDLAVALQEPALGSLQLESLQLRAIGSLAAHTLSVEADGDIRGKISVRGEFAQDQWQGILAPASLDTRHGQWQLTEAVALQWRAQNEALSLQGHCWRHPELALCVDDAQLGAAGELQLTAQGSLAGLNGLLPPDLELAGDLGATLEGSWGGNNPLRLNGRGRSQGVTVTRHYGLDESISISWDSLSTELVADDTGLNLQAEMEREGRRVLAIDLALPAERTEALTGRINLQQLRLGSMAPWAPELSRLEGMLDSELVLSGTIDAPRVSGPVSLTGGNLALVGNPTEVTDLNLTAMLRGDRASISGRALLGGGELEVQGELLLEPDLQLDLQVAGNMHQILLPPSTEIVVSEDLVVKVVPGLIDITGDIRVVEGVLRHEQLPAGSVALSPDVITVDIAGNPLAEGSAWAVRSDVWIHLRDRFQVVGDNLSATVGGDLHMRQGPGKPLQLFGNLNILGGELRAYRQQLVIRRGTVAFSGPPDNPELNIRAEREIRDQGVTVGASLQGRLEEPSLEVYSDPPMSQGEAMSYLVRGRGLDSGAGADGTALALAMGADLANRSGILSPVNQLPGINNVSFGSTGTEENTAATVSGYLGDRIYLSYGVGLYEPVNVLTARLYLQARLWLEVVSRLENSVDIYYSFDID